MVKTGSVIDGKYKILTEIGHGGMSVVYLAMDTRLNKQWAVKEIRKKDSSEENQIIIHSLLAEANLMKRLDHPALPRIVDIIDEDETVFIVMDYIEGESLDQILSLKGAQPEDQVIVWARQLCDVLIYLHSRKPPVIYRDMKPANIILKPEGNIKIIDFGIAREYKELSADTALLGTRGYAPPEQYQGQTDIRSDVYSLGMTMHHLLTGADPRKTAYAPIRTWNDDLSEGMEAIVDRCVQPDPEKRYQNCEDLLYDLGHPELITKDYWHIQKRKWKAFLAAAVLAVVLGMTGCVCRITADRINNNNYEYLLSLEAATSLEDKIESYEHAIEIYPERTEAYICILEAYEWEGRFGKEENDSFLALYNKNKFLFDTESAEYAELNYRIGRMYFNYYTEADGESSFSGRIQKAYSFFAANEENAEISPEFQDRVLSGCYYEICSFYKKYIFNHLTVEEASAEDYNELLRVVEETFEKMETAGVYDRLTLYNSVFILLYDQRISLAQTKADQEKVESLLDTIYGETSALLTNKAYAKELQNEILDHYDTYSEAIRRAYVNVGQTS